MSSVQVFSEIPTSLVCGFLGVGKTTTIRHLIRHRPAGERWAVVVNEFGQVGIDASLLDRQQEDAGVVIQDIPGGCLCCVTSQSFNVGLNRIIRSQRPDRIIIEPTGLGHPTRLINTLRGEYFNRVIDLKAVITLLDARQLNDPRYLNHDTFIDQLEVADILVANKLDQYSEADRHLFYQFVERFRPAKQALLMVEQGRLPLQYLDMPAELERLALHPDAHLKAAQHTHPEPVDVPTLPAGWYQFNGEGNGFVSRGWRIDADHVFNRQRLVKWLEESLHSLLLERIKGVVYTDEGWLDINMMSTEQTFQNRQSPAEYSLLEMIGQNVPEQLYTQIHQCLEKQ